MPSRGILKLVSLSLVSDEVCGTRNSGRSATAAISRDRSRCIVTSFGCNPSEYTTVALTSNSSSPEKLSLKKISNFSFPEGLSILLARGSQSVSQVSLGSASSLAPSDKLK